jgi:hypothetical protein
VIDVAASPEKRKHESKMIAATVIQKTQRLCPSLGDVALPVGILGTGAVGAALAGKLAQSEDSVRCYSPDWNVSEWTTGVRNHERERNPRAAAEINPGRAPESFGTG